MLKLVVPRLLEKLPRMLPRMLPGARKSPDSEDRRPEMLPGLEAFRACESRDATVEVLGVGVAGPFERVAAADCRCASVGNCDCA